MSTSEGIAFGPVPSRRLGRSLGINNIPPKVCSYSCVYCQIGRTVEMCTKRRIYREPEAVLRDVRLKVELAASAGETVDYLAFVPDGEPTLDVNLGREIELVKSLGIPVAVISNASLVSDEGVRDELHRADWVSLKVDAVREETWHEVDRPHGALRLDAILEGIRRFAEQRRGAWVTETMLVAGCNDDPDHLEELGGFLAEVGPDAAYVAVPTRPPAEPRVRPPSEETLHRAYRILSDRLDRVEYLIDYEGDDFSSTGSVAEDLLGITAVHPMREGAVLELLARTGATWELVRELIDRGRLVELEYAGARFYARKLSRR